MPRRKINYQEGDWVALPLVKRGGWALGLIARCKAPTIIGYFFGPRHAQPPTMQDTALLRPQDALLVADVGDPGLRKGEWLIIGHQPDWRRQDWPLPKFWRDEGPRYYLGTYDEDNPARLIHEELTTADKLVGVSPKEVYGYVALSLALDKALAEREARTAA